MAQATSFFLFSDGFHPDAQMQPRTPSYLQNLAWAKTTEWHVLDRWNPSGIPALFDAGLTLRQTVHHLQTGTTSQVSIAGIQQLFPNGPICFTADEWCLPPHGGSRVRIPVLWLYEDLGCLRKNMGIKRLEFEAHLYQLPTVWPKGVKRILAPFPVKRKTHNNTQTILTSYGIMWAFKGINIRVENSNRGWRGMQMNKVGQGEDSSWQQRFSPSKGMAGPVIISRLCVHQKGQLFLFDCSQFCNGKKWGPGVARFSGKLEIRTFMWSLPIFRHWQLIQTSSTLQAKQNTSAGHISPGSRHLWPLIHVNMSVTNLPHQRQSANIRRVFPLQEIPRMGKATITDLCIREQYPIAHSSGSDLVSPLWTGLVLLTQWSIDHHVTSPGCRLCLEKCICIRWLSNRSLIFVRKHRLERWLSHFGITARKIHRFCCRAEFLLDSSKWAAPAWIFLCPQRSRTWFALAHLRVAHSLSSFTYFLTVTCQQNRLLNWFDLSQYFLIFQS